MRQMYVIGEDALCCALGERLVTDVLGWSLAQPAVDTKGVSNLAKGLPRYRNLARLHPVLCVADSDGRCPVELLARWMPSATRDFLLRLAVSESESWLLADHEALSDYFGVPLNKLPARPDDSMDAKRQLLTLASKARQRVIRQEVVSAFDPSKPGSGYKLHMGHFARQRWSPKRAAERSPSLRRAISSLERLGSA
jgi:hypothetical protein